MGSINIIKPLCTVLDSAVYQSGPFKGLKIFGNAKNQTRGSWVRSENLIRQCTLRREWNCPLGITSFAWLSFSMGVISLDLYSVWGHSYNALIANITNLLTSALLLHFRGEIPKILISSKNIFMGKLNIKVTKRHDQLNSCKRINGMTHNWVKNIRFDHFCGHCNIFVMGNV